MARLPIIVGFGGYNAAGRSSFHHGFRRMTIESLDEGARQETLAGLGVMTGIISSGTGGFTSSEGALLSLSDIEQQYGEAILNATLIRRIEKSYFDVDATPWQQSVTLAPDEEATRFLITKKQLPNPVPASWRVAEHSEKYVSVTLTDNVEMKVESVRDLPVKSAGQLPTGFNPSELYNSRFHPRGLQMTIVGVSDALHSMGIPWTTVMSAVQPDQVSVHASSVMSQVDENGLGGMMQSRLRGGRVSAKQLPLGLNTMPADFINAYVLGNVGTTGAATGACATFLYNLKQGVEAIQSGKSRVAVVGNSEAPITQEVIDGFAAMSALGTYDGLKKLEGTATPDLRRSSRPFGDNCGFTIAEATQFVILMDDELVMELGAQVHGAVTDVFVNADGYKKSISAPGPGNYLTLAKAVAAATKVVGEEGVRKHSFIHAHGSSTPANRVTESELFHRIAEAFGIEQWPVAAVKAFVGHSIGPASGDQVVAALGSFRYGMVPGIKTIDKVADDVHSERLQISTQDIKMDRIDVSFINSKGFGGNNATGVVISPNVVKRMLAKRYSTDEMAGYTAKLAKVEVAANEYDQKALQGEFSIIYHFGQDMINDQLLTITDKQLKVPGWDRAVEYSTADTRYEDML